MTVRARQILDSFNKLPEQEKKTVTIAILRQIKLYDWSAVTDNELTHLADNLFFRLDKAEEKGNGRTKTR